jgi:hypothetical protein
LTRKKIPATRIRFPFSTSRKTVWLLVAIGQIAVQGRTSYSESPADNFPVFLHPTRKSCLVGIELGGSTELAARPAGVVKLQRVRCLTNSLRTRSSVRSRPPPTFQTQARSPASCS